MSFHTDPEYNRLLNSVLKEADRRSAPLVKSWHQLGRDMKKTRFQKAAEAPRLNRRKR